jgi:hypothetical protein
MTQVYIDMASEECTMWREVECGLFVQSEAEWDFLGRCLRLCIGL